MMKVCGIYAIRNINNGKSYIGSSCHIDRRFKDHRYALIRGVHANQKLQHAWNKYGPNAFVFEVVELCPRPDLLTREQQHIDALDAVRTGYNCRAYTTGKTECTPATRALLSKLASERQRGRKRGPMSEAQKRKLSDAKLGRPLSEERKQTLSRVRQGHPVSQRSNDSLVKRNKARAGEAQAPEHVAKRVVKNTGQVRSQETKDKMAEARRVWWATKRTSEVT